MAEREEPKPKIGNLPRKQQIICKFWMRGNCNKDEKCEYLHNQSDFQSFKGQSTQIAPECPMYSLGFCKSGPMCKYNHIKKTEEENPYYSDNNQDGEEYNILPMEFLEYFFEKPIGLIFEEFEIDNHEDTDIMKTELNINPNENIFDVKTFFAMKNFSDNFHKNFNQKNFITENSSIINNNITEDLSINPSVQGGSRKNSDTNQRVINPKQIDIQEIIILKNTEDIPINSQYGDNIQENQKITSIIQADNSNVEDENNLNLFSEKKISKFSYKNFVFRSSNFSTNYIYSNNSMYKNYINSLHFNGFNKHQLPEPENFNKFSGKNFTPTNLNIYPSSQAYNNPNQNLHNKKKQIFSRENFITQKNISISPNIPMNNNLLLHNPNDTENLGNINENYLNYLKPSRSRAEIMKNLMSKNYQNDIYAYKKNSILENLNTKVSYFFLRYKNFDLITFSMETNLITISEENSIKFLEALNTTEDLIFIYYDDLSKDFYGFSKFKYFVEEEEVKYYLQENYTELIEIFEGQYIKENIKIKKIKFCKIEWLWKTKLNYDKVEILRNPLNNYELFINSKDGQEISSDLGFYVCRLMIKRLIKEEVDDYKNSRNIIEAGKYPTQDKNMDKIQEKNFLIEENSEKDFLPENFQDFSGGNFKRKNIIQEKDRKNINNQNIYNSYNNNFNKFNNRKYFPGQEENVNIFIGKKNNQNNMNFLGYNKDFMKYQNVNNYIPNHENNFQNFNINYDKNNSRYKNRNYVGNILDPKTQFNFSDEMYNNQKRNNQDFNNKKNIINISTNNIMKISEEEKNNISNDIRENLNNILFDNINGKNNKLNQLNSNNGGSGNITTSTSNNIIVTNISNLQVNISQNSYNSEKEGKNFKEKNKNKKDKKNSRSRSRSFEIKRNKLNKDKVRKRNRNISNSRSLTPEKNKNRNSSNSSIFGKNADFSDEKNLGKNIKKNFYSKDNKIEVMIEKKNSQNIKFGESNNLTYSNSVIGKNENCTNDNVNKFQETENDLNFHIEKNKNFSEFPSEKFSEKKNCEFSLIKNLYKLQNNFEQYE